MANRTIALLLRVSINGKQPYLKPTLKNGKLRNKYTNYKGEDKHFPDGVYVLRYKQGSRLVFKTVGKALDAALMAQRRKEAELQAESAGLLIHSPQPALVEPKKPKTDITVAVDKFLDDVAMRDRVNTVSGYSSLWSCSCQLAQRSNILRQSNANIAQDSSAFYYYCVISDERRRKGIGRVCRAKRGPG